MIAATKKKITFIELDETEYLHGFENDVKKFSIVYFFDPEQYHHYCSAEKLYWLVGLYWNFELHDRVPEDEKDAVHDWVENALYGMHKIVRDDYYSATKIQDLIQKGAARHVTLEFDAEDTEDDIYEKAQGFYSL